MKIIGFYGWSGSGKTDLICRVIKYFKTKKLLIATIKHTHHNISIDKKGKDSYSHREAGASEVLVGGDNNWSLIHNGKENEKFDLNQLIKKFSKDTDILIVEGMKTAMIPKVEVYNSKLNKEIISSQDKDTIAIVYDQIDNKINNCKLPKFDFKNTIQISEFIINYFRNNEKKKL